MRSFHPLLLFTTLVAALVVAILCDRAEAVKMFIVAGQSNASGRAISSGLPAELRRQDDIRYWFDTDRGTPRNSFVPLVPLGNSFGPEISLGRKLADTLADDVVIVKVAFGGTTLAELSGRTDWSPNSTGEHFARLISNVTAAKAALVSGGEQVHLAGMFWMQGESDAKSGTLGGGQSIPPQPGTANDYEANLNEFIQQVRSDLSAPKMPFFIGKINIGDNPAINTNPDSDYNTSFGEWDFTPVVQAAQDAAAAADPTVHVIETANFRLSSDFLHFDARGQLDLGDAFAASYLQTIPEPTSGSLVWILFLTLASHRIPTIRLADTFVPNQ